jgi:mono/diheme cytochrome c family protein
MRKTFAVTLLLAAVFFSTCKVKSPGKIETATAHKAKQLTIGGKNWKNPVPETREAQELGANHFQHHCQVCHGLDGHATGVPFADRMSPPVPDLAASDTQDYADGQLKWIVQKGVRFSGMPAWEGILSDEQMWQIVRFMRHLPKKGSLGVPAVFKEEQQEHEKMHQGGKASGAVDNSGR